MSLVAENVSIELSGKRLINDVCLMVESGELIVIVGPNGAGKSTLMKALCGDYDLTGGDVYISGHHLANWDKASLAQTRAVLPQHTQLSFSFTVEEVVQMGRAPYRYHSSAELDNEVIQKAMAMADVSHLLHRNYASLSGGEAQRVQLARVLAQLDNGEDESNRYLFLDEPTASLDPAHQHATLKIARELTEGNVAVLAVLHDLNLASVYADKIVVLSQGVLKHIGSPRDVLTESNLSDIFELPVKVVNHPVLDKPLVVHGV